MELYQLYLINLYSTLYKYSTKLAVRAPQPNMLEHKHTINDIIIMFLNYNRSSTLSKSKGRQQWLGTDLMSAGSRNQIKASLLFKTCWAQYARWGPLGLWKHVFTINSESVTYQTVGSDCVCACVWVGGKTETKESVRITIVKSWV